MGLRPAELCSAPVRKMNFRMNVQESVKKKHSKFLILKDSLTFAFPKKTVDQCDK
jgi:hypothetical protein